MRNGFFFFPFGTRCIRLIDGITRSTTGVVLHRMYSDGGATAVTTLFSLRLYDLILSGLVGFLVIASPKGEANNRIRRKKNTMSLCLSVCPAP
jgi:hypothetical protein